jgi:hypothetical protein
MQPCNKFNRGTTDPQTVFSDRAYMLFGSVQGVHLDVAELRQVRREDTTDCTTTDNAHFDRHTVQLSSAASIFAKEGDDTIPTDSDSTAILKDLLFQHCQMI